MPRKIERVVWKWGSDPGLEGNRGKDRGLGHRDKV